MSWEIDFDLHLLAERNLLLNQNIASINYNVRPVRQNRRIILDTSKPTKGNHAQCA